MPETVYDCIVVGSGASGILAAHSLIKKGWRVAMIDGGTQSPPELDSWFDTAPETTFYEFRRFHVFQRRLFLGKEESVLRHIGDAHSTQMTSGWREFITQFSQKNLPLLTNHANIMQSLARGGLTEAWGGACDIFDQNELQSIGLSKNEAKKMKFFYRRASKIVGTSGPAKRYYQYEAQPPIDLDHHGKMLLKTAEKKKHSLRFMQSEVYQPLLAVLTQQKGNRHQIRYTDLDFWTNTGKSIFRPHFLLEQLLEEKNFSYFPNLIVRTVSERMSESTVTATVINTIRQEKKFYARRVILAAGSVNTTRILLQSLQWRGKPQPFMIKPHLLVPSLHWNTIGQGGSQRQVSLCQIVIRQFQSAQMSTSSYAQLYSYRSLLLYKLLEKIPLPTPIALRTLALITPSLVVADIRFSSTKNTNSSIQLEKKRTHDVLNIQSPSLKNLQIHARAELKKMKKTLRSLGLFPFSEIWMENGSSAHYAGGAPMSLRAPQEKFLLSSTYTGKVRHFTNLFIADATTWKALPAKPPTLTIMANALRIAEHVAKDLRAIDTSHAS